ncbi:MAG: hypothetical protein J2P37_24555 [Ktedonobacteraceae bacterium]|nr:hypothetical protein [Ktedonobacteraceae bacterium]
MRKRAILFCIVVLCGLPLSLATCVPGSNSKGDSISTSTAASTVSAHTTAVPGTATHSGFSLYKGEGYIVAYPENWRVTKSVNAVNFSDDSNTAEFAVQMVPNPNSAILPEQAITTELASVNKAGRNYKKLDMPSTVILNGTTWFQAGASADMPANGRMQNGKVMTLATNYPEHAETTTLFSIVYASSAQRFDSDNRLTFLPMLQSFKFA